MIVMKFGGSSVESAVAIERVASIKRKLVDGFARDRAADRGVACLHRGGPALDGDLSMGGAHFQGHIHAQRLINLESVGRSGDAPARASGHPGRRAWPGRR